MFSFQNSPGRGAGTAPAPTRPRPLRGRVEEAVPRHRLPRGVEDRGPRRAHQQGGPVLLPWRLGRAPRIPRKRDQAALRVLLPLYRRGGGERGAYPNTSSFSGKEISQERTETHPSCSIPVVPGFWGLLSQLSSGAIRACHA